MGCAALAFLAAWLPGVQPAAAWSGPTNLSAGGGDAESPKVAVDRRGDAVAVWVRSQGRREVIESATRPAGGAWSSPVRLSAGGDGEAPQIALDRAGDAVVVWQQARGHKEVIESATRPAGGVWSRPVDLSAPGRVEAPEVAIDSKGEAVAVWVHSRGARYVIQSATLPVDGTWSAPADLAVAATDTRRPQVAVDEAGDAAAVWQQIRGGNDAILAAARPAGGAGLLLPCCLRPARMRVGRRSPSTNSATRWQSGSAQRSPPDRPERDAPRSWLLVAAGQRLGTRPQRGRCPGRGGSGRGRRGCLEPVGGEPQSRPEREAASFLVAAGRSLEVRHRVRPASGG